MIQFAFKIAAKSGSAWSKLIARESGSPYSHVECWLDGPKSNARCFSSREPHGAGFQQIDLTADMWEIVPLICTPEQDLVIQGYAVGADGKMYDGIGLLGYDFKNPAVHDYHALFCSECCANMCRCAGKVLPRASWLISPGELHGMLIADFEPQTASASQ